VDDGDDDERGGTLFVPQGTAMVFRARPQPEVWPEGEPEWQGPDDSSGFYAWKTFNGQSSSPADYKDVTVSCGNTLTVHVVVYNVWISGGYDLVVDDTVDLTAEVAPDIGGTHQWATTSSKVTLLNESSDTVTVEGDVPSDTGDDVAIDLLYTPPGQGVAVERHHWLTVIGC